MITEHKEEITEHFVDTAKLMCALMKATHATSSIQKTVVTAPTGEKYTVTLRVHKEMK